MNASTWTHLTAGLLALCVLVSCGGDSGESSGATDTSNGTADTSNGTSDTSNGTADTSNGTTGEACPLGYLGCSCIAGTACFPGSDWVCVDGTCQEPECLVGTVGCACFENGTCDLDEDGEFLECNDGLCEEAPCPEGSQGCPCLTNGLCAEGLECQVQGGEAVCDEAGCEPGAQGCGCRPGDDCDGELVCQNNACVEASCTVGTAQCPCGAGGLCDDGLTCNAREVCEPIGCTAGAIGCECDADGGCTAADGVCEAGRCQRIDCPEGAEGCACSVDEVCGQDAEGNQLDCEGGVCRSQLCAPGTAGCACVDGYQCDGGLTCDGGLCFVEGCSAAQEFCRCASGGCLPGLRCQNGVICTDNAGYPGGACLPNDSCNRDAQCLNDRCVACNIGSLGCGCDDNDACNTGLTCMGTRCVAQQDLTREPPAVEDQVCYTPCSNDLVVGNTLINCDANGLMEGCIDGNVCVGSSCVLPNEEPDACLINADCPDYQSCHNDGRCYSECKASVDCPAGMGCDRYVCRVPCDASSPCPTGSTCDLTDGENGFCIDLVEPDPDDEPIMEQQGNFELSTLSVEMTNVNVTGSFQIINNSPTFQTFTIKKLRHTVYSIDGTTERSVRATNGLVVGCEEEPCVCVTNDDCEDNFSCNLGECRPQGCPAGTCPMFWLGMGERDAGAVGQEIEVGVESGRGLTVELTNSDMSNGVRWTGDLQISNPDLGVQNINLTYTSLPEGQWSGEMVYLASFGTNELDRWVDNKTDDNLRLVGNALVQRWGAFRSSRITWDEFLAVLTATQSGSWKFDNVMDACDDDACYLYSLGGIAPYSSDLSTIPVPTGAVELSMSMNLRLEDAADPNTLVGRVVSDEALQYAGFPSVRLEFASDPRECEPEDAPVCLAFVNTMRTNAYVGGRYLTTASDVTCSQRAGDGYTLQAIPWLLPGFNDMTSVDPNTGERYRYECRDGQLPFDTADNEELAFENTSLALSNPIPDGRARRRTFSVIDGALINQNTLFILFQEHFESFLGADDDEGFTAYGYIVMRRNPTDIDDTDESGVIGIPDAYEGTEGVDTRDEPEGLLNVSCDGDILDQILTGGETIANSPDKVVQAIIDGVVDLDSAETIDAQSDETIHYLCFDTGLIDGGPGQFDTIPTRTSCPIDSEVAYFTLPSDLITQRQIAALPCQSDGSCVAKVDQWRDNEVLVQDPPVWRCADDLEVFCDDNRMDLLDGKVFYAASEESAVFVPLQLVIDSAFRYKTRFRNRRGQNPGFTPEICVPDSNAIPYCYDPSEITEVMHRTDCLLEVWQSHFDGLSADNQEKLTRYLEVSFSTSQARTNAGVPISSDGFERLNAELLIMLGDESFTEAFASRYDLAGAATTSFEGALFEQDGINLSGVAGYEMYSLYQATQYYQMALDRFYSQSPLLWDSIGDNSRNFVTPETVILYFDRLIRASTQKSRAWAQIAKRYSDLNRSDLAQRVAERAYTATYLESVVLSRMMLRIVNVSLPEDRAQIQKAVEDAQLSYRSALLDMQDVHSTVGDDLTLFGFQPDYIPFPALDSSDFRQSNAFELLQRRVESKLAVAAQREQIALESDRSFETSTAQFQSELTNIRNNYETRLGDLCGTFEGPDGRIYPAIEKYASLDEAITLFGNPCGFVGNGQIFEQVGQIELLQLGLRSSITRYDNIVAEIDIEAERVSNQCDLVVERADFNYEVANEIKDLEQDIRDFRFTNGRVQSLIGFTTKMLEFAACSPDQCPAAAASAANFTAAHIATEVTSSIIELKIGAKEREISNVRRDQARWNALTECDGALIESNARTAGMLLRLKEAELEILRAEYQMRLAISGLQRLRNQARRLASEQEEAEQLAINVQAAQNNPNVRIYRNDAIINAEIAFEQAIREVYKLTTVFEYYTSTSYANKSDLFLIRMVQRGNPNLENYVAELLNTFYEFEESFGLPDTRVEVLSLRDDILNIPRLDADGQAISQGQRYKLFVQELTDVARLDSNGYITIPFSTSIDDFSPLTRNHKILYLEADIFGSDNGDTVGRVYIRQNGTGVIRTVDDTNAYYRFDERTAVINTIFNGNRFFDPSLYKNYRMRDRPLVNTNWELVINQRDERANQDINLAALNDIRIYVFYGDLTAY